MTRTTGSRIPPRIPTRHSSIRRTTVAATLLVAVLACAPEDEPVPTTMPPRDPAGAALRRVMTGADAIDAFTFARRGDISVSDRVLLGFWEGLEARAFLRFEPDSFIVSSEGDTLAGSVVEDAALLFNCAPGQGDVELAVAAAGVVADADWSETNGLSWPGPDLLAETTMVVLPNCESVDDFPEREVELPPALIQAWIDDPESNNGLGLVAQTMAPLVGGGGAMLQIASSENNFAFLDSVGTISSPPGPRLRFRTALDGGAGETVSVFLGTGTVTDDAYAISPDAAELPCADPADCIEIGRGAAHRAIFLVDLPDLPRGVNVHQATMHLSGLGHPRFDAALELQVFRLTSLWPDSAPADSLVETSGVLWHTATLDSAGTSVDVTLTDLVQAWYDGVFENRGFLVRASREDASVTTESFAGPTHPNVALRPDVEIVYTSPYESGP